MKTKLFTLLFLLVLISACSKKKSITGEEEIVKQEGKETIYTPSESKLSVHDCAFSTATVKWEKATIEDNSEIKYDLYLNDKIVLEDNMETEYSFKELKEKTKYTVKLVAKSKYSTAKEQSISFTTTAIPVPNDNELLAKDISLNAITVMWKDDAKSDVKYDLYLNDKKKETDLKASSYTFKELETGTKYTIKLVSKNSYNKTKEIVATFSTKDYPSPTASTLSFRELRDVSVVLCWNKIENEENTYSILLDGKVLVEDIKEDFYGIESLKEGILYEITLVSKNKYGKTTESKISIDTSNRIDPRYFEIELQDISDYSAKVYVRDYGKNKEPVDYKIFVNGEQRGDVLRIKENQEENHFILENLEAETRYEIRVEASNSSLIKQNQYEEFVTLTNKGLDVKLSTTFRSIKLEWSMDTEIRFSGIFIDGYFKDGFNADVSNYTIRDLNSNSEHFIIFYAETVNDERYYRYFKVKTDSYPKVHDYNVSIVGDSYKRQGICVDDFDFKNADMPFKLTDMACDCFVDDEHLNECIGSTFFFTKGEANKEYTCRIEFRYPDMSIADIKTFKFRTPSH